MLVDGLFAPPEEQRHWIGDVKAREDETGELIGQHSLCLLLDWRAWAIVSSSPESEPEPGPARLLAEPFNAGRSAAEEVC